MARMEARLKNHEDLDEWMRDREESNAKLARKVQIMTGKKKVSVSLIAHLRRGARSYCDPTIARAIEKILRVKQDELFLREVIGSSQAVSRTA